MKYLLILLIFVCGCNYAIKENSMTITSVNQGNQEYKYTYTIKAELIVKVINLLILGQIKNFVLVIVLNSL